MLLQIVVQWTQYYVFVLVAYTAFWIHIILLLMAPVLILGYEVVYETAVSAFSHCYSLYKVQSFQGLTGFCPPMDLDKGEGRGERRREKTIHASFPSTLR
jgi:hypothetical protein